jgi:hypothetical protein
MKSYIALISILQIKLFFSNYEHNQPDPTI